MGAALSGDQAMVSEESLEDSKAATHGADGNSAADKPTAPSAPPMEVGSERGAREGPKEVWP